jgi:hypothetical protein
MATDDLPRNPKCGQEPERWRPVPSEPGVLVSSLGRVLLPPSYAPVHHGGYRLYAPKPRVGQVARAKRSAKHEFMLIKVKRPEKVARQASRKVHQLVCEAFHGPKPFPTAVVIHLDENALNNRPENLKWGTQKENLNMPKFREQVSARQRGRPRRRAVQMLEAAE